MKRRAIVRIARTVFDLPFTGPASFGLVFLPAPTGRSSLVRLDTASPQVLGAGAARCIASMARAE